MNFRTSPDRPIEMEGDTSPDLVVTTLNAVERLRDLLLDPHPGLPTWYMAVLQAKANLDKLFASKEQS